ncbi:hypothetical protein ACQY0O_004987, partial [Thecaphora frezii]
MLPRTEGAAPARSPTLQHAGSTDRQRNLAQANAPLAANQTRLSTLAKPANDPKPTKARTTTPRPFSFDTRNRQTNATRPNLALDAHETTPPSNAPIKPPQHPAAPDAEQRSRTLLHRLSSFQAHTSTRAPVSRPPRFEISTPASQSTEEISSFPTDEPSPAGYPEPEPPLEEGELPRTDAIDTTHDLAANATPAFPTPNEGDPGSSDSSDSSDASESESSGSDSSDARSNHSNNSAQADPTSSASSSTRRPPTASAVHPPPKAPIGAILDPPASEASTSSASDDQTSSDSDESASSDSTSSGSNGPTSGLPPPSDPLSTAPCPQAHTARPNSPSVAPPRHPPIQPNEPTQESGSVVNLGSYPPLGPYPSPATAPSNACSTRSADTLLEPDDEENLMYLLSQTPESLSQLEDRCRAHMDRMIDRLVNSAALDTIDPKDIRATRQGSTLWALIRLDAMTELGEKLPEHPSASLEACIAAYIQDLKRI